ncbi:MAG: T9SS type A sorting domain-containing protein [Bacteroidota bacterium]
MKILLTPWIMTCIFFITTLASNNLSVVSTSRTHVVVQLQNTELIAGIQFTLHCSSNVILSDPERSNRISDTSWMMATYKPNDSTMNVLFINMSCTPFGTGTGSLMQLTLTSSGEAHESYIMFANVMATNSSADSVGITVNGLQWSNKSNHADANGNDQILFTQNYPNPFNPTTTISFIVTQQSYISLKVYDQSGREVGTIVNDNLAAGSYSKNWNAAMLPTGTYYCRLSTGSIMKTQKIILLK